MGIRIKHKGDFKKTESFLKKASTFNPMPILERYGEIGVEELQRATPVKTGLTRDSWYYEIEESKGNYTIHWNNSNMSGGMSVAMIIRLGHTTSRGTYVPPNDFITPALEETFNRLAIDVWKEVTS